MSSQEVRYWEWPFDGRFYFNQETGIYFDTMNGVWGNTYLDQAQQSQPGWSLANGMSILESLTPKLPTRHHAPETTRYGSRARDRLMEETMRIRRPYPTFIACTDKHDVRDLVEFTAYQLPAPFRIITGSTENWEYPVFPAGNAVVYPTSYTAAQDMILALAGQVHDRDKNLPEQFLLIDNLTAVMDLDHDARQNLRWLLMKGPAHRISPIIFYDQSSLENVLPWVQSYSADHHINLVE